MCWVSPVLLRHADQLPVFAEELNKKNGWDIRIHVDAATGGFIAPFIHPDLKFDFRLKNVNSISTSGHK